MIHAAYWAIASLIAAWSAGTIWIAFFSSRDSLREQRSERWKSAEAGTAHLPLGYRPADPEKWATPTPDLTTPRIFEN